MGVLRSRIVNGQRRRTGWIEIAKPNDQTVVVLTWVVNNRNVDDAPSLVEASSQVFDPVWVNNALELRLIRLVKCFIDQVLLQRHGSADSQSRQRSETRTSGCIGSSRGQEAGRTLARDISASEAAMN
jgi:hypothetical protein